MGLDTDQHSFFPPDPYPDHARGQELTVRGSEARWLLPANTGVLRRAQPAAPYGTPRHQTTSQAILNSGNCTEAPTRTPPDQQDTHNTARDRPTNTSTSAAPPSKHSTLGLSWGPRGCTAGD